MMRPGSSSPGATSGADRSILSWRSVCNRCCATAGAAASGRATRARKRSKVDIARETREHATKFRVRYPATHVTGIARRLDIHGLPAAHDSMKVDLTPEQNDFVRHAVETGRVLRAEDAVQEA